MFNLPNSLSLLRVLFIPMLFVVFSIDFELQRFVLACLFALAAITDMLDGFLARTLKQTTRLGGLIDPVADKVLVISVLFIIVFDYQSLLVLYAAAIIGVREIVMSALRQLLAEIGKSNISSVSFFGKAKTACQMLALFLLLLFPPDSEFAYLGVCTLILSATLTCLSLAMYMFKSFLSIKQHVATEN